MKTKDSVIGKNFIKQMALTIEIDKETYQTFVMAKSVNSRKPNIKK